MNNVKIAKDFSVSLGTYSVPKGAMYVRIHDKPAMWAVVTDYAKCASGKVYPVRIVKDGGEKCVFTYARRHNCSLMDDWTIRLYLEAIKMCGRYPYVTEHIKNERGRIGAPKDKKVNQPVYNMRHSDMLDDIHGKYWLEERYLTDGVVVGKRRLNHEGYAHERLGISVEVDVHIMDELDGDITELPSMDEMKL